MTTLLQDIQAALVAIAPAGRSSNFSWNSVNTAEPPVYPYVIFQRVVSTDNNTLAGPTNLQNTHVQIDVIDRTASGADALAKQVRAAMLAAFADCTPLTGFDVYEDAIKAFRVSADYSIWATN